MTESPIRPHRVWMVLALLLSGMVSGIGIQPALAQVTAVQGSASGYILSVSLLGGAVNKQGPAPTVNLPAGGSSTAVTATAPSTNVSVQPATFFSSGQVDVSTQGTPAGGSVTSSVKITDLNKSDSEVLRASNVTSTCTASASGVTGSTTVTGGTLQTDNGDDNAFNNTPDHAAASVPVPANPTPGQSFEGHIHVGDTVDNFTYIFNEQIKNADGSLTVNAIHQKFKGSLALGDLIVGQSICGVTGSAPGNTATTAAGATTTTVRGATTTTAAGATTTTAAGPTTTTAGGVPTTVAPPTSSTIPANPGGVGGGAYGYFVTVSLFGGAAGVKGPAPTVTLPDAGSASPVTDTAASANVQFGPAIIFTSDKLEVSTQGTPGGTVTSSASAANVNRSGQEQLTAATATSKCTASSSAQTGSTTLSGAKLVTSSGTNFDSDADDTVVQLPADPAPNTPYEGKIEQVGDTFRVVLNEQITSAGSITVNAVHIFLLGPVAVGEVIIGQSRCGTTSGTAAAASAGGATAAGGRTASTGTEAARLVAFALLLVAAGGHGTRLSIGRSRRRSTRPMPWPTRSLLR